MKKIKKLIYLKFARKLSRNSAGVPVPTIISEGSSVKGDLFSDGIIHIDGNIDGDITCNELVIGNKGHVLGTVNTQTMHLYGSLQGKVLSDKLFIAKTAKLIGDITHNSIAIEPGAYIDGHCIRATTPIHTGKPELKVVNGK